MRSASAMCQLRNIPLRRQIIAKRAARTALEIPGKHNIHGITLKRDMTTDDKELEKSPLVLRGLAVKVRWRVPCMML